MPDASQPLGGLLSRGSGAVEIMVAGRCEDECLLRQTLQVLRHHHDLDFEWSGADHLQVVAGYHHHVDVAGLIDQPVELRQAIVQVRRAQELHAAELRHRGEPIACVRHGLTVAVADVMLGRGGTTWSSNGD